MILAAGLGTRLKPLTNNKPKALIEVGGFTMLEMAVLYLKKFGIREIVINVHHFADQIIEYIHHHDQFGICISVSNEQEKLMDTGGAIVQAASYFDKQEPFILMGVDILTDLNLNDMIRFHLEKNPLVTLAVKDRPTTRPLLFDADMSLIGWRNIQTGRSNMQEPDKAAHALGFSVVHIIHPNIFELITEKGPFPIMDLYMRLMSTQKILGFRHDEDTWLEFGRIDRINEYGSGPDFQRITGTF